ncbi:hypothetical protein TTRE_0000798701 [Trichuris trichiura]|uniref:Uncharacterized protein n=1 Tax=Trichuris trichiura TaxID=36087 RepID=A0A077ZIU4_TRITR|nr:hypothetical protein TTRE_0000798701 [Trichuris trichiura]
MIAAVSNTALQRAEAKSHSNILGKFGNIATMCKTKCLQAGFREKPTMLLREPHLSSVFVFSQVSLDSDIQNNFSCEHIADCAKRYKLQGGPADQLCSHNSQVALELGRENVKRTEAADEPDSDLSSDFSSENCTDENEANEFFESCSPQCTSQNSFSRDYHFDLWYSWAPRISPAFRSTVGSYEVPKDAFEDTSEVNMQEETENVPKLLIPLLEDDFVAVFHELISNRKQKSVCRYVAADPSDFVLLVSCMLNYYVEKANDVQMSVTMLIVLGETGNGIVSESVVKRWFLAYIDLLRRYQLYSIAALVTSLCPIEEIKSDKNQQCTMNILCSRCQRSLQGTSNFCVHCDDIAAKCCVCHGHVQSLYVCCPGCLHGGHVAHIEEWFNIHDFCPTGCGHPCEYS